MRWPVVLVVVAASGASSSCADPDKAVGFDDKNPAARLRAVRQAAQTEDRSAIRPLITRLDSDDPAERLLAIRTLERLTGETRGYDHAAPRHERDAAVRRWAEWYLKEAERPPG